MYACVINNYVPLFITNMFGVCTGIGFVAIFYIYTTNRKYVYKMCGYGLAVVVILLLYTILAAVGVTGETRDHEGTVLGWIMVFVTVVQFGSPLATMKRVIRTKSNASLPFFLCLMNVINCGCWVVYSSLEWNAFIWDPSVAGTTLGIIQVVLWMIYRQPSSDKTLERPSDVTRADDLIEIEGSQSRHDTLERSASLASTDDSVFIEIATPRKQKS